MFWLTYVVTCTYIPILQKNCNDEPMMWILNCMIMLPYA